MRPAFIFRALVGALGLATTAQAAGAQLANASTAATGLGGAYTAVAKGYNAVYWNPANLAMPGNPGFSLTFGAIDGMAGIRPIDFTDIQPYAGKNLPSTLREQWMLEIEAEGAQRGNLGGGITELGLSIGNVGIQANTKIQSNMDMSPGMMEAILFGNAGRDSLQKTRHDLSLAGTGLGTSVYTAAGLSYAFGLPLVPLPNFKVGVTGKYIYGHALVLMQDQSSTIGSDIAMEFPAITTDSLTLTSGEPSGSGMGLDLGAAWTIPGFRFGVSMQNVVNTFKWDTTTLVLRHGKAVFNSTGAAVDGDSLDVEFAYSSAPAALKEQVVAQKFKPVLAAGMSFDWLPKITVSADIRQQVGEGIERGPESMIAAGAEVRWIPFIPLRGGVQMMTGGFGLSGGVGIHLLGFEAGLAGYLRNRDGAQESGATINIFSIRP
jgi:hypothetical protein